MRTIFTIGFIKSSIRKCVRFYYNSLTFTKVARLNNKIIDSNIITLDNDSVLLSSLFKQYQTIPIILSMGSYTWPPYVRNIDIIKDIYHTYGIKIKLISIYIEEAHAKDDWILPSNIISDMKKTHNYNGENITIAKSIDDRINTAKKFVNDFDYPGDIYCDNINNDVMDKYECWPERLYIIMDNTVVYKGGRGPFHYKPDEVKAFLKKYFQQNH